MVFGAIFLFMLTQRSFNFGTIQFSLLKITTYELSESGWEVLSDSSSINLKKIITKRKKALYKFGFYAWSG
jgi:hypothetical protein